MATNEPVVRIDRVALTETQLRATEIMLYQIADIIDRLLAGGLPYTKIEAPQAPSLASAFPYE